ncbi:hypothetical protein LINGRAHAP2_LOCUS2005 [Linum grandiflorum]
MNIDYPLLSFFLGFHLLPPTFNFQSSFYANQYKFLTPSTRGGQFRYSATFNRFLLHLNRLPRSVCGGIPGNPETSVMGL